MRISPRPIVIGFRAARFCITGLLMLLPLHVHASDPASPGFAFSYEPPVGGQSTLLVGGVPLNCSTWLQYTPGLVGRVHQDEYLDDGDGQISVGDVVTLDGIGHAIMHLGVAYQGQVGETMCHAEDPYQERARVLLFPGSDSDGPYFDMVYVETLAPFWDDSLFGRLHPQQPCDWDSDGDGLLTVGQYFFENDVCQFQPRYVQIEAILTDVHTAELGAVATSRRTWGQVRQLFGGRAH